MKPKFLSIARWILLGSMGLLALYKLAILFLLSGALVPRSSMFGLVWISSLVKIPAIVFSRRHRLILFVAGTVDWLLTTWVFQIQEQHATLATAFQNSFLDLSFVVLAGLYFVSLRATQDVALQRRSE